MKNLLSLSAAALLLTATVATAQNAVGTNGVPGAGNAVGEKESYNPNDPARSGAGGAGSATAPGVTGAGTTGTDKESYPVNDPSRTGKAGTPTSPNPAGGKGDTGAN